MIDATLDLQIQEITLLMSELKSFRDIIVSTLNTEVVVPENEERLTKIKEIVPQSVRRLCEGLAEDYDDNPETIVNGVSNLPHLIKYTDLEKRKLMDTWHRYYMKLSFMIGKLKSRKQKVESLSLTKLKFKKIIFSPATIIVFLAIVVFLIFIVLSNY